MDHKQNCIYITYDGNLKRYLTKNGIDSILYGLHPKTKRMFWVYQRDEKLNEQLVNWFKG